MKTAGILIIIIIVLNHALCAQEEKIRNGFSFGFQVAEYHRDFAFGVNFTSPLFKESAGVRLRANMAFLEYVSPQQIMTWTPYTHLSLGFVGIGGVVSERIRVYGEGGVVCILPSSAFSTENVSFGGYGLFGFEFFMAPFINYFIEVGGVGTGAVADKVPTQPLYSNGLMISAGFRVTM